MLWTKVNLPGQNYYNLPGMLDDDTCAFKNGNEGVLGYNIYGPFILFKYPALSGEEYIIQDDTLLGMSDSLILRSKVKVISTNENVTSTKNEVFSCYHYRISNEQIDLQSGATTYISPYTEIYISPGKGIIKIIEPTNDLIMDSSYWVLKITSNLIDLSIH